jgi:hypothetical protein
VLGLDLDLDLDLLLLLQLLLLGVRPTRSPSPRPPPRSAACTPWVTKTTAPTTSAQVAAMVTVLRSGRYLLLTSFCCPQQRHRQRQRRSRPCPCMLTTSSCIMICCLVHRRIKDMQDWKHRSHTSADSSHSSSSSSSSSSMRRDHSRFYMDDKTEILTYSCNHRSLTVELPSKY